MRRLTLPRVAPTVFSKTTVHRATSGHDRVSNSYCLTCAVSVALSQVRLTDEQTNRRMRQSTLAVLKWTIKNSATICTLTVPVPSLDKGGGDLSYDTV